MSEDVTEVSKERHEDSMADAIAAIVLIALVVISAVFWVASQG